MTKMTVEQFEAQWRKGNNDGEGYAPGNEDCQDVMESVAQEEWEVLDSHEYDGGAALCRKHCGGLVLVMDANGPWAVDLR